MTDAFWMNLMTSIVALASTTVAGVIAYYVAKLKHESEQTALKLAELKKTGEAVHTLVNSAMSQQLKVSAIALRRVAQLNPDNADDAEAARLAEDAWHTHEAQQKIVDAGNKVAIANGKAIKGPEKTEEKPAEKPKEKDA